MPPRGSKIPRSLLRVGVLRLFGYSHVRIAACLTVSKRSPQQSLTRLQQRLGGTRDTWRGLFLRYLITNLDEVKNELRESANEGSFDVHQEIWSFLDVLSLKKIADQTFSTSHPRRDLLIPARKFVQGIRHGEWKGKVFEVDSSNPSLSECIRDLLNKDDTTRMWEIMKNPAAPPNVRDRVANSLLGRRLGRDASGKWLGDDFWRAEQTRVADLMKAYYWDHVDTDHWAVSFGLALALANEVDDRACLSDWIERTKVDSSLLDMSIENLERYYGGRRENVERYVQRIDDYFQKYPAARLWEVFYLGQRAEPGDTPVVTLLNDVGNQTKDRGLKLMCADALVKLDR